MSGRSIAPRPARLPESVVVSTDPIISTTLGASQSASVTTGARKKVTSACLKCQKRRVKCNGNNPCATCVRTSSECLYTPALDGRSIKRKYLEVQRDQELLHDLLETIRYTKDEHISHIISLIRSDASMADVKACVVQQLLDIRIAGRQRSPEFKRLQNSLSFLDDETGLRSRNSQRPDVLGIHRLADRPLYRVSASPWTTVTDDDDLVSNLISVWLTWDKGWCDWIDEDIFIREMQAGSVDSMFCSPFLVNAVLAWACPYSDYKEARTNNGAVSKLMLDFIAEGKRLMETAPTSGLCLTTVQGLLILYGAMAVAGNDSPGYRYMLQALGMAHELVSFMATPKMSSDPRMASDIAQVIDRTCWGMFIVTTQTLTTILKPQRMQPPRRPRPAVWREGQQVRMWRPYLYKDDPVPARRDEVFDFGCDLAIIEARLSRLLFDVDEQPTRKELEAEVLALYTSLQARVMLLDPGAELTAQSAPSVFTLRTRIQSTILRMFVTLRESVPGASAAVIETARTRCVDASLEMARISKMYMQSWGPTKLSIMICHPVYLSISILQEAQDMSLYDHHITDLCVALRAMGRRWPIALGMLRMVQLDARNQGWRLPPDTDKLFEEFERSAWRQRELKRYISLYPMANATKTGNPSCDEVDMGTFLERADNLALDDSAPDSDDQ